MHKLARLDQRYLWHPFTQMRDWFKAEPIVIVQGKGACVQDARGRRYLDANASIWTNLHGHNQPLINRALRRQLRKIAHSSALGLANEPASVLAEQLVQTAQRPFKETGRRTARVALRFQPELAKVFYSDDGSTAMEVALKLAYEYARRTGLARKPRFLSLTEAYHGDTLGAVSLGHIDLFHKAYAGLVFRTETVMAPYCYRCRFNRALPERADARCYRRCRWECVAHVEARFGSGKKRDQPVTALVIEPLIQGAAGMIPQPPGWLRQVADIARAHRALFIADEVMTAFGRAGGHPLATGGLLACHQEGVQPDLVALAKGLTGGYLPLAATLATRAIFDVFLGDYAEFKTFFHGHSYTGNQLGCAAALASLQLLQTRASRQARARLETELRQNLSGLWTFPSVGDIRQVGLIAGIELVQDWRTRRPFGLRQRVGARVCEAMARRGVLTRPIGDVVVLMPPYATTPSQVRKIVEALADSVAEVSAQPGLQGVGSQNRPRG